MRKSVALCTILLLLAVVSPVRAQSSRAQRQAIASQVSGILAKVIKVKGLKFASVASQQAPTDGFCLAELGAPCYSPQQMQNAYGLTPTLQAGYTGAGQTIVIFDSFGSPTIAQDLKAFDQGYGLPDPPTLRCCRP